MAGDQSGEHGLQAAEAAVATHGRIIGDVSDAGKVLDGELLSEAEADAAKRRHLMLHGSDDEPDATWGRYQFGDRATIWKIKLSKKWRDLIFYGVVTIGVWLMLGKIVSMMQLAVPIFPRL